MSRTLRYILTIVLILAAAAWIFTVYKTCQKPKTDNTEVSNNDAGNATVFEEEEDPDDLENLYEEDDEETGEEEDSTGLEEEDSTVVEEEEDSTIGEDGNYMVVAGAFVAKHNADRYQKQLSIKGYQSTVRIFLGSEYHAVIVGNYATEKEAQSIARELGGEAYVHKKRYPKNKR